MLSKLSQREQIMVAAGAIICVVTAVYLLVFSPYRTAMEKLDRKIAVRQQQLKQVKQLQAECATAQATINKLQQCGSADGFALFSFVENQIIKIAGRGNLTAMRPLSSIKHDNVTEETVEVKIERVSLNQIVQLLQNIDNAPVTLQVKKIQLKVRYDDVKQLDASMHISVYTKVANG